MSRLPPPIIGAEDDDFDTDQEQVRTFRASSQMDELDFLLLYCAFTVEFVLQVNGQCSCFQTIDLLKTRPAHLAAFLHHVVSQFDPAPLVRTQNLCIFFLALFRVRRIRKSVLQA